MTESSVGSFNGMGSASFAPLSATLGGRGEETRHSVTIAPIRPSARIVL